MKRSKTRKMGFFLNKTVCSALFNLTKMFSDSASEERIIIIKLVLVRGIGSEFLAKAKFCINLSAD